MKLMKLFIVFLLIFFYLYISYIRFYHFIGDKDLKSPYVDKSFLLENHVGEGSAKYLALGDSLTAGVGSSDYKKTFVYLYALKLLEKYNKIEFTNLGQPGATTAEVIEYQIPIVIEENPDHITLLIGVNDIHNKRPNNDFKEKYGFILNELLSKTNAKITVIEIPYLGSSEIVYPPFDYLLSLRTKQFNKTILDLANDLSYTDRIQLALIYENTYTFSRHNQKFYSPDLFHPSDEGYTFWGQIINAY